MGNSRFQKWDLESESGWSRTERSIFIAAFLKIRLWLLYNLVLVSEVQWSESAICIHIPPPLTLLPTPLPHPTPLGHRRALSWAPCAIQQLPTSYLFYMLWNLYEQGRLVCCSPWGRRVEHDWVTELNWTESICVNATLPSHPTLSRLSPTPYTCPFSISVSLFLPHK